jgi:CelD/BcsL family acetyltransferase involved in cellulose biosynthesis
MNDSTPGNKSLRLEVVSDAGSFEALASEWNALAERMRPASVFLRHEWFDACWQWRALDSEIHLLCLRRGDLLVGILPLARRRMRRRGVAATMLEPLAVPDTQRFDLIAAPADYELIANHVLEHLGADRESWDLLRLDKLTDLSAAASVLRAGSEARNLRAAVTVDGNNPSVGLSRPWGDYYATRSRRLKKANNYVANLLKRSGKSVELRHVTGSSEVQEIEKALQAAIDVSARSWKQKTSLTLDNAGPGAFIRRLTEHARRNDWLSVFVLEIDGQPAAVEYQLNFAGEIAALRADYDPQWEELSPGSFLSWRLLESLFNRGLVAYRMGPGRNEYKLRWADHQPQLLRLQVANRTWRGRWIDSWDRARERLSRLRQRYAPTGAPDQET